MGAHSALAKAYYFTLEQYLEMEREAEYKSEYLDGQIYAVASAGRRHFTRQADGSWRLIDTHADGAATLKSIGCTLVLNDVYDKVTLETPVRLMLDEPH